MSEPRETAEEVEEGQERVDEAGELALPSDESLGDLEEVEVEPAASEVTVEEEGA